MSTTSEFDDKSLKVSYVRDKRSKMMTIKKNTTEYPTSTKELYKPNRFNIDVEEGTNIEEEADVVSKTSWYNYISRGANKTWDYVSDSMKALFKLISDATIKPKDKDDVEKEPDVEVPEIHDFNPIYKINELEEKWMMLSVNANDYLDKYDPRASNDPIYGSILDVYSLKQKLKRKVLEAL